jgi:hypothetical protein
MPDRFRQGDRLAARYQFSRVGISVDGRLESFINLLSRESA